MGLMGYPSVVEKLLDVNITSIQDNDILRFDNATQKFLNEVLATADFRGARVRHSANQAVTNTLIALAFDTEDFDTDVIHDTVTNNSRLTVKTAGKYYILGHVHRSSSTADQELMIRLNGTTIIANEERDAEDSDANASEVKHNVMTTFDLAVNDFVELMARVSTGTEDVNDADEESPVFQMYRIGA